MKHVSPRPGDNFHQLLNGHTLGWLSECFLVYSLSFFIRMTQLAVFVLFFNPCEHVFLFDLEPITLVEMKMYTHAHDINNLCYWQMGCLCYEVHVRIIFFCGLIGTYAFFYIRTITSGTEAQFLLISKLIVTLLKGVGQLFFSVCLPIVYFTRNNISNFTQFYIVSIIYISEREFVSSKC